SPGGTRALASWFPRRERGLAMGIRQTGVTVAGVLAAVTLPGIAAAYGWQDAFRVVAVAVLVLVAAFVIGYREPDSARDVVAARLRLLDLARNRTLVVATGFGFVFMAALGATVTYTTVTLHEGAGLGAVAAGFVLALVQVGATIGRIGWGLLSDRLGRRAPVMVINGSL